MTLFLFYKFICCQYFLNCLPLEGTFLLKGTQIKFKRNKIFLCSRADKTMRMKRGIIVIWEKWIIVFLKSELCKLRSWCSSNLIFGINSNK